MAKINFLCFFIVSSTVLLLHNGLEGDKEQKMFIFLYIYLGKIVSSSIIWESYKAPKKKQHIYIIQNKGRKSQDSLSCNLISFNKTVFS